MALNPTAPGMLTRAGGLPLTFTRPTLRLIEGGRHMTQHDGSNPGLADRVADSAIAKIARGVVLPLISLIALPLVVTQWNGLRSDIDRAGARMEAQNDRLAQLDQRVTTIDTKLDAGLLWRLTQLERRVEAMEERAARRESLTH